MNDRQDSLKGKLIEVRNFTLPINSLQASIDAARLTLDIGNSCTFSDNFLGDVPQQYFGKEVRFQVYLYNDYKRRVQVNAQKLSCEKFEPVEVYYEFAI